MEIRENLELVAVDFENGGKKAVLTFLDMERKEVRTVNFNKQSYKDNAYVDDPDKAAKVDEWCDTFFQTPFDNLASAIGQHHTIYIYERFNSMFEVDTVSKFTKDQAGQIFQTEVKEIIVDDYFIKIRYIIDGETYESKMTFGNYVEPMQQWFVDPQKKEKVFAKFEDKFGVPVEEKDELVGHPLMVEVKTAFGTHLYGDIKKFPKK